MASPDSDAAPNEPKNFSDIVEAAKRSAQDKDYDISQFGDPVKKEGRLMAKYKRIRNVVFGDQGVT
ncbi:MAG: hypothetical protein V2I33_26480, partial [Kangiellaceae bacterium]|nr:hypothetical protein [Kangiellaceae bacterium]